MPKERRASSERHEFRSTGHGNIIAHRSKCSGSISRIETAMMKSCTVHFDTANSTRCTVYRTGYQRDKPYKACTRAHSSGIIIAEISLGCNKVFQESSISSRISAQGRLVSCKADQKSNVLRMSSRREDFRMALRINQAVVYILRIW